MAVHPAALQHAARLGDLERRVSQLCGRINALEGDLVRTLAELLAERAHEGVGWRSPGHYVAWLTGAARSRTSALVTAAQRRHEFPLTTARLDAGEISLDQTVAAVRTAPVWADRVMADAAVSMTPAQLATMARLHQRADEAEQAARTRRDATPPAPPAPPAPPVHEYLHFTSDDSGRYAGRLCLDADHGAQFETALRAHLDVLWTEWTAAGSRGARPQMLDALHRMMRRAADAAGLTGLRDHQRHLVVLHVDVGTSIGQVHLGPALPAWATSLLSCDATYQIMFTQEGRPLGVGPSRRLPRRLRLAVEHRDGGCRVPGCGSRLVHLHHIHHHAHGGASDTGNLVGLCPAHHRAVHRGQLILHGEPAGVLHQVLHHFGRIRRCQQGRNTRLSSRTRRSGSCSRRSGRTSHASRRVSGSRRSCR